MAEHGEPKLERPVEGAAELLAELDTAGGRKLSGPRPANFPQNEGAKPEPPSGLARGRWAARRARAFCATLVQANKKQQEGHTAPRKRLKALSSILSALVVASLACGSNPILSPPVTSSSDGASTEGPAIPTSPPDTAAPTRPNATATPSLPALEILSHTSYTDAGWYHIVGEIRNNSNQPMTFVKIVATPYDDSGAVVGSDFTYTELDVIPPGGKSPFETGTDQWQGTTNYKLQAQGDPGPPPRRDILIKSHQSYVDGNWLHVRGEVENTGTTNAEFVKIVITLYDAAGTVIGADFTYTELDTLPPGGTSPFETGTDHWPGFDHYEIQVQAN